MNANTSSVMNRTILSLVFGLCLFLTGAPEASAHKVDFRPYYVYDNYAYHGSRAYPGWLRRNREFQRWYTYNHYRFRRHMSWHRLYDIYRAERRFRLRKGHFYGKVYRDNGYPAYHRKPHRRR